jgi:HSP20 family protein
MNRPDVHIPVDVIQVEEEFEITAYVPGLDAEAIEIEIIDDTISIKGEFNAVEDEDVRYLLRERPNGRFIRKLRLPNALDSSKANAEVRNGVLTLRVSKAEHEKAKLIKVKAK